MYCTYHPYHPISTRIHPNMSPYVSLYWSPLTLLHTCRTRCSKALLQLPTGSSTCKSAPMLRCWNAQADVICVITASTFSTCHLPKVLLTWWLRAALASLLFDPEEPRNIGKNKVFRDFSTLWRTLIFFLLALSLLSLSILTLLFSDCSH